MLQIPEVVNTSSIRTAEFVKLTIVTSGVSETFAFSTAAREETVNSTLYPGIGDLSHNSPFTPLGMLLSVGQQQRDLRATSFDTTLVLSGVDGDKVELVLNKDLKGSKIWIGRGFYNTNYELSKVYLRFSGVVTSYSVSEDTTLGETTYTVALNCSSFKSVLENNRGGRRTNRESWDKLYAGADTSMYNVENLANAQFDFGRPVTGQSSQDQGSSKDQEAAPIEQP